MLILVASVVFVACGSDSPTSARPSARNRAVSCNIRKNGFDVCLQSPTNVDAAEERQACREDGGTVVTKCKETTGSDLACPYYGGMIYFYDIRNYKSDCSGLY